MPKVKKTPRFVGRGGRMGRADAEIHNKHSPLHVDIENSKNGVKKKKNEDYGERENLTLDDLECEDASIVPKRLSTKLLNMIDQQQKDREFDIPTKKGDEFFDKIVSSDDEYDFDVDECNKGDFVGECSPVSRSCLNDTTENYIGDLRIEKDYVVFDGIDEKEEFHGAPTRTLAEIVLEELKRKKSTVGTSKADIDEESNERKEMNTKEIPAKVQEVYTSLGDFLSHYRSGKLPKAFKIIPRLTQWEQILVLTQPEKWTPNAMLKATKLFASNLDSRQFQRFLSLVLFPNIRVEIQQKKKCHYHHYMAIKKSFFKPAAFIKGVILPLALDGTCSLRERIIIGSVIKKVSIPVLHSAAALMRLCLVTPDEWNPAVSHFIGIFLDKKYSLPSRVIDSCVDHFYCFARWDQLSRLPVVWHTALLILTQRYKFHLSGEQKSKINHVLKFIFHEKIGIEIRRELSAWNPVVELERRHMIQNQHEDEMES